MGICRKEDKEFRGPWHFCFSLEVLVFFSGTAFGYYCLILRYYSNVQQRTKWLAWSICINRESMRRTPMYHKFTSSHDISWPDVHSCVRGRNETKQGRRYAGELHGSTFKVLASFGFRTGRKHRFTLLHIRSRDPENSNLTTLSSRQTSQLYRGCDFSEPFTTSPTRPPFETLKVQTTTFILLFRRYCSVCLKYGLQIQARILSFLPFQPPLSRLSSSLSCNHSKARCAQLISQFCFDAPILLKSENLWQRYM